MGVKKFKPTSPSARATTVSDFAEITRHRPERSLLGTLRVALAKGHLTAGGAALPVTFLMTAPHWSAPYVARIEVPVLGPAALQAGAVVEAYFRMDPFEPYAPLAPATYVIHCLVDRHVAVPIECVVL